ncbi:MAG: prepilin-type N-terminal cleavage/methylation domain-containing protein [Burkholderiales bacterium]|nr:prepilin-type N-terminal cleavage/methylation domain-containing protein [Burkholderiales bacterium]
MPHTAHPSPRLGLGGRGFTLVELMLALLVLGVLAGLAIPGYNGWQDKVRVKKAQEDIIAISVVIDAYLADTGALPADLAAIGRAGLLDPWGSAYQYQELASVKGKGKARKDHSLVPLNSDYDLYSMGPDRASVGPLTARASRDDILRARNGQFVGPASLF